MTHLTTSQQLFRAALVLYLSVSGLFSFSGLAFNVRYNEIACCLFLVLLVFLPFICNIRSKKFKWPEIIFFYIILIEAYFLFIRYNTFYQVINYTTLFLAPVFIYLFRCIPWRKLNYFKLGLGVSIIALIQIFLLGPGLPLHGWNPNSSICVLSAFIFGSCLILQSAHKKNLSIFIFLQLAAIILVFRLENRSSFLALLLFNLITYSNLYKKKLFCFVLSLGMLFLNVVLPYFQTIILNTNLFSSLSNILEESFGKTALNGREKIWPLAVECINQNLYFGSSSVRSIYFHNMSIDILLFSGIFGLFAWMAYIAYILLRNISDSRESNIFAVGFAMTIFFNTFENIFVVNNFFAIMPYAFLAFNSKNSNLMTKYEQK